MAETKKKRSYAILTIIATVGFVVFIGTLAFEVWKPIIFNQYKFLNVLLKISVGITLLSLIIELILAILDGAQNVKDKRKKTKQRVSASSQNMNTNDSYSNQSNMLNSINSPTSTSTMNINNNFNELNSPIHSNVILQTKYKGKTFIVRIKQKMKVVNK